jgi:sec-independent protein translocase protein TatA
MFGEIGLPELLIILVILLLLFGPSKLGDLGSSLGKGIKGFRKAMKETDDIDVAPSNEADKFDTSDNTAKKEEVK